MVLALENSLTRDRRPADGDRTESGFRIKAAYGLLAACLLFLMGIAWDLQWHGDVGPDTFFTASHLMLYSGAALGGLVALLAVIVTTVKFKRGVAGVTEATTTRWLGIYRAPVGFIIGGLGSLSFLLSGFFDLYWHTQYGFDVTLISPPHFGLIFSGAVLMVGSLYTFASEYNRAKARGADGLLTAPALGLAGSAALLMSHLSLFAYIAMDFIGLLGPILPYAVAVLFFVTSVMFAASSLIRKPGIATLIGLFVTAIRWAIILGAPAATRFQASIQGLPLRGSAIQVAVEAVTTPALLIVTGFLIDLGFLLAARLKLSRRLSIWGVGALAAAVNFLIDPRWPAYIELFRDRVPADRFNMVVAMYTRTFTPTLIAMLPLGALFAWMGYNLGTILRYSDK